ncbi:MAG: hypothetical protein ACI81Y_002638 [Glaciecola sp.]|jgi:hypothetical protein
MRKISLIILGLGLCASVNAQKHFTKAGSITFYSDAPTEKIEAVNSKATSVIDTESGDIQWSVLIKAFKFEKALMEEHFNENYMESSKFPKGIFKGKITNLSDVDFSTDGEYTANIAGSLTIHGVEKEIETTGLITILKGDVMGSSEFEITLLDYEIEIPSVVADNISKTVLLKIHAEYAKLAK